MVRDPRDDVINDWGEQELRRGLAVLIRLLRGAIADTVQEGRLKRDDEVRLGNERYFVARIPGLVKALDHPDPERHRERLYDFYAALGAAGSIIGRRVDDPILNRWRTATATGKNSARKERIKQIIADEWAKLSRSDLTDEAVANLIQKKVCARAKKTDLKTGTITKYMRELRAEESSD
jgi:hypothetical protein